MHGLAQCTNNPVLFLVSRASVSQSYVLPLTRPEDISYARGLIAGTEKERDIPIARIAKGADGINRDLLKPGAPQWSWHVVGFDEFSFAETADLDFPLSTVEADVDHWIKTRAGRIGFGRPVRELPTYLWLRSGAFHNNIVSDWRDLGTNYVYTLEQSAFGSPSAWFAVPGFQWPTSSTTFSLRACGPTNFYFRVRGEKVN